MNHAATHKADEHKCERTDTDDFRKHTNKIKRATGRPCGGDRRDYCSSHSPDDSVLVRTGEHICFCSPTAGLIVIILLNNRDHQRYSNRCSEPHYLWGFVEDADKWICRWGESSIWGWFRWCACVSEASLILPTVRVPGDDLLASWAIGLMTKSIRLELGEDVNVGVSEKLCVLWCVQIST